MQSLRIKRGIEVEVNDAGESIVIPVEDAQFSEKFYGLLNRFQAVESEITADKTLIEVTKEIMAEIDDLLGQDSCRKVFGNIIPSPYLLLDFFDQLLPVFEEYIAERRERIAEKYNRGRKGVAEDA